MKKSKKKIIYSFVENMAEKKCQHIDCKLCVS